MLGYPPISRVNDNLLHEGLFLICRSCVFSVYLQSQKSEKQKYFAKVLPKILLS